MKRMKRTKQDASRRSAELYSAVSRICNPLGAGKHDGLIVFDTLPNAIRRYGRLQICATRNCVLRPTAPLRGKIV